jgi:uncharacterized membrane protein
MDGVAPLIAGGLAAVVALIAVLIARSFKRRRIRLAMWHGWMLLALSAALTVSAISTNAPVLAVFAIAVGVFGVIPFMDVRKAG